MGCGSSPAQRLRSSGPLRSRIIDDLARSNWRILGRLFISNAPMVQHAMCMCIYSDGRSRRELYSQATRPWDRRRRWSACIIGVAIGRSSDGARGRCAASGEAIRTFSLHGLLSQHCR
jgi:hypothetical protein